MGTCSSKSVYASVEQPHHELRKDGEDSPAQQAVSLAAHAGGSVGSSLSRNLSVTEPHNGHRRAVEDAPARAVTPVPSPLKLFRDAAIAMPEIDPPRTEYMQRCRREQLEQTPPDDPLDRGCTRSVTDEPAPANMLGGVPTDAPAGGRSRDWADTRATSTLLRDARGLNGRCRPLWVGLAEVELSPSGLAMYMWPLVLYTTLLLASAVAMVCIIYWIPAYRLYWDTIGAPANATRLTNLSGVSLGMLERAPMPPNCHRFDKNSGRLTAGVQAMLDSTIQTPYMVDALPDEPHHLAPGLSLVLRSLVVEEVSHGQWTFGLCWTRPWYESIPDQLVLRLRRIGLVATLTMQVVQHVPLLGEVVVTTGTATVEGHGVIFLDDIDLEEVARPVKKCAGRFLFTVHSVAFDVGGFGAGVGSVLDEMDVGAVFPVQEALCFGSSHTSLADSIALLSNASAAGSNSTGAASLINAMVWELMPRTRQAAEALLEVSAVVVVLALLLLLTLTASAAIFVHDDSPAALARAVAAALLLGGAGFKAAEMYPFVAATLALVALLLFSAWRAVACTGYYVATGWDSGPRRQVVLASAALLGALLCVAFVYRGTTSARWLFLAYCLMLSSGAASWIVLPFCTVRTCRGVHAVGSASAAAMATPDPSADTGREDSTTARVNLFLHLNHRLKGLLRCYLSMLLALVLAGIVVVFSMLKFSRDINSRMHSGPPMLAPAPPPAPPLSPPDALLAAAARALSYATYSFYEGA